MSDHCAQLSWTASPFLTWIEISGPSHLRFIQGLCTNDVVLLESGSGCEAFFPTVQGKILAHGFVYKSDDRLEFLGLGDQSLGLLPHLQKYSMIEDVEVSDRSTQENAIFVWGEGLEACLQELLGSEVTLGTSQHGTITWEGATLRLFRTSVVGKPSVEIRGEQAEAFGTRLSECGATSVGIEVFQRDRIVNRFPWHGVDISAEHLAQEANRDDLAISFKKGCYLGQETIARIDALGHVNKKLVAVQLPKQVEELPLAIKVEEKEVGQVVSAAELDGQTRGLAMIRRSHNAAGTKIECELGTIEVL